MEYVLKRDTQAWPGMAADYLSSQFAEMIGLPVPRFCVAQDMDGSLVFASQIYGSPTQTASSQADALNFLANKRPDTQMLAQISKLYAFDLFLHNTDRHLNNYLFRRQNNADRVIFIDFDRALFHNWPMPDLPMCQTCNTIQTGRCLRQHWGFDRSAALALVMRIARLPERSFHHALNSVPSPWLDGGMRDEMKAWWSDGRRLRRLRRLWMGLKDGTLL